MLSTAISIKGTITFVCFVEISCQTTKHLTSISFVLTNYLCYPPRKGRCYWITSLGKNLNLHKGIIDKNPNQQTVLGRISGILVALGLCPLVVLGTPPFIPINYKVGMSLRMALQNIKCFMLYTSFPADLSA